jgi:hypothetical protein
MTRSLVKIQNPSDAIEAEQLTAQYDKAISGLLEQVKFGAMMLTKEKALSMRGRGGPDIKGDGLKGWLEKHCPKIHISTAWRFKACAEAVKEELQIGDRTDMSRLLGSAAEALNPKEQRVRKHIESFLAGKSQRQLLLDFRVGTDTDKKPGGHPELNAFIKERYPELSGQRLSLEKLTTEMREEFEAWKVEQNKNRPSGLALQKKRARDRWMKLEQDLIESLARKDIGLLDFTDRKRIDELFSTARKTFAEAMK